jgi:hypothetical protein
MLALVAYSLRGAMLARFRFPALVISGRYDMNVAHGGRLAHAIPGARPVLL